jgi:hypothetical protein
VRFIPKGYSPPLRTEHILSRILFRSGMERAID